MTLLFDMSWGLLTLLSWGVADFLARGAALRIGSLGTAFLVQALGLVVPAAALLVMVVGSGAPEVDWPVFAGYTVDKITIADGGIFHVAHESHIDCVLVDSDVVLMSTEQVKEIVRRRFGELKQTGWNYDEVEQSLLDRIDTWTIAEGMEF